MPRFLYTMAGLDLILWILWFRILVKIRPESPVNIIIFLSVLFAALTLLLSLPIYKRLHKKSPQFTNLRVIYRRSLKWAMFYGGAITILMALRAFKVINPVTLGLFAVLIITIFYHMKKKLI